jgi:hypothetical protein
LPVLQETAIRARYLTERQSLRSRAAEVQASYQAQRGDLEGQEKETRRLLTGASAAIARTQRELHAYRQIAFLRYLRRIVFL